MKPCLLYGVFIVCLLYVYYMFIVCLLYVYDVFIYVYCMFMVYFVYVYCMFILCLLNVIEGNILPFTAILILTGLLVTDDIGYVR